MIPLQSTGSATLSTGRSGRRSRTGCLTCRQRKKKCDEKHPTCGSCVKLKIDCSWSNDDTQRKPRLHRPQTFNHDFSIPSEISHYMTVFASPSMTIQQRLISHFISSCPIWISSIRASDAADFLRDLIPTALRNGMIMDCVLAIAAGDLGKIGVESAELECLSRQHYGVATAALSSAITSEIETNFSGDSQRLSEDTLMAALLLCVHEAVNFTSSENLLTHINGAATLLSERINRNSGNADLHGFLLELFCYFYTLAATTHGHQMKVDTALAFQIFHCPMLLEHRIQGMLLGSSPKLFYIILRLSMVLNNDASLRSGQRSILAELSSIELDLEQCFPGQGATCHSKSATAGFESSEAWLTSELYYLACKLQIRQATQPIAATENEPWQNLLFAFFVTLEKLSIDSPANGVLCWPLFIAGLSAITGKHRSAILARLKAIGTGWRSSIASQTSKFLTRQWKESRNSESVMAATTATSFDFGTVPMILV